MHGAQAISPAPETDVLPSFRPQPRPKVDRRQSLAAIPTRSPAIRLAQEDAGAAALLVPVPKGNWGLLSRFVEAPEGATQRVELDEIGRFVWQSCDGHRSVLEVIDRVIIEYGFSCREGEMATVHFLRSLARRNYLALVILDKDTPQDADDTP